MLTDSNEIYALEQAVLSEVLETYYERGEPAFLDCADLLSGGFEDSGFKDTILSLYHFSCSMPFPEDWLGSLSRPYGENGAAALSDLPWTKDILEDFRRRAQSWADSYRQIFTFLETNRPSRRMRKRCLMNLTPSPSSQKQKHGMNGTKTRRIFLLPN